MPTTSNIFCAECCTFMLPKKNGVVVEEKMSGSRPYKLWHADLYKCPACNKMTIIGFGNSPVIAHFEPDYDNEKKISMQENNLYEENYRSPREK